ncbi:MAG: hypothetical protein AAB263_13075 [Planctomycetota bacterium]
MFKLTVLLAATACLTLTAAEGGQRGEHKSGDRHCGQMRQRLIERFDTDKNGKLSDTEKAAAKSACQEHRAERKAKFDTDKDGKWSDGERDAARDALAAKLQEKHPKLFAKVDANSDGQLSKDEVKAAREERRDHCGKKEGKGHAGKKHEGHAHHGKGDK